MKNTITEKMIAKSFEKIINHPKQRFATKFYHVVKELNGKQGIPDYVVSTSKINFSKKLSMNDISDSMINRSTACILSFISPTTPHTIKFLLKKSGLSDTILKRGLNKLIIAGLITKTGKSSFKLSPNIKKFNIEFWAFELKINNWQRAFYQALQYKAFAHIVFVVISEKWSHRVEKQISKFRYFNVGLIAIDHQSSKIRIIYRPQKQTPSSRIHYYYAVGKLMKTIKEMS
jgi:hypothetical protein